LSMCTWGKGPLTLDTMGRGEKGTLSAKPLLEIQEGKWSVLKPVVRYLLSSLYRSPNVREGGSDSH